MFRKVRIVALAVSLMTTLALLPVFTVFAGSSARLASPASLKSALLLSETDNFTAHLNGASNVPSLDTNAQAEALFQFDMQTNTLYYKILAANIQDVFASHIHCAGVGSNGSAGVTLLFTSQPISNPTGIVIEGTVSAPDPGNACGWTSLADVENAIRSGNAYVNLHTTEYPKGMIRGQIH